MFLAAPWLWALPAALLPVVFHLIQRRRRRAVVLPTLMFLRMVDPRHRARRRLRELLVLLLRILAVAAVVLALSRPVIGSPIAGAAAVLLLIDNSASTALPSDDPPKRVIDLETAAAATLLAALGSADVAAVVPTVPDTTSVGITALERNREAARAQLNAVRPSDAASRPAAALRRAAALLAGSTAARRELHLFTDAQAGEWAAAIPDPGLPPGVRVVVHRVTAVPPPALPAITGVRAAAQVPAGRPLVLHATLANGGSGAANGQVQVMDDLGRTAALPFTIPAGGSGDVPVVLPASDAGERVVRLHLDGGAGPACDATVVIQVVAPRSAVMVGGRRALGAVVPAIDPSGDGTLSGLKAVAVDEGGLAAALAGHPALVCVSWSAGQLDRLETWVAAGGCALVVPPADGSGTPPAWCGAAAVGTVAAGEGQPLIASDAGNPLLHDLVAADGSVDLGRSLVRRSLVLRPTGETKALLSIADGRVVAVHGAHGRGQVVLFGFPWFRAATDLPTSAAAMAIAQGVVLACDGQGTAPAGTAQALVAGEPPRLPVTVAANGAATVRLRDPGDAQVWQGPAAELPPPPRAGAWRVQGASGQDLRLAVRADPGEAQPRWCAAGSIPALAACDPDIRVLHHPEDAAAAWNAGARRSDLSPWLVLLALLALALESWLANPRAQGRHP